jgi:peptide/nickel transport system permease protein
MFDFWSILRRFAYMLFVMWVVATIIFFMFRLMPGSPLTAFIGTTFTDEQHDLLVQRFGLDKSLFEQYSLFLVNTLKGDFGLSFTYNKPVIDMIIEALPNSIILTLFSLLIAYIFGIIAGAYLAWKRATLIEGISIPIVLATRSAPEFWLGMIALALFSFQLDIFPSGGTSAAGVIYASTLDKLLSIDFYHHLILPSLVLALYLQGLPLLLMRSNMLEVMQEDFITMSKMKGLSSWRIVIYHAARNALLPVATAFTLGVGFAFGGNVVIETVFSWPGLGRLLVFAVSASDYPLAQGAFIFLTGILILMNFLADLMYLFLDPRVSYKTAN